MSDSVSTTTCLGVASCAFGCGCFVISWLNSSKASQTQSARPIDRLSDLRGLVDLLPLLVAVTGYAWSAKPLKGELSQDEVVVQHLVEQEDGRLKESDGQWRVSKQTLRRIVRSADWRLVDNSCPGNKGLPVLGAANADVLDLVNTGDVYISADSGGTQSGVNVLITRSVEAVQGYKVVGYHTVERSLPVDTKVTVIGEVVNTNPTGPKSQANLVIQPPRSGSAFIISKKSFEGIVAAYQSDSEIFKSAGWFFGSLGVLILGSKAALFGWSKWRARKTRLRREEADRRRAELRRASGAAVTDDGAQDSDLAEGDRQCVICLERRSNMVFPACGHLCTCTDCSSGLNRCPICRTRTNPIRVYHS